MCVCVCVCGCVCVYMNVKSHSLSVLTLIYEDEHLPLGSTFTSLFTVCVFMGHVWIDFFLSSFIFSPSVYSIIYLYQYVLVYISFLQ